MNQIKYLVNALLLIFLGCFIIATVSKLTSASGVKKQSSTIDFIGPPNGTEVANSNGKKLFSANCQTCHALDKVLTGPALRGVESRGPWVDRKNLFKWINNPAATINKFLYTKDLAKEFGQIMPSFPNLEDKEIEAIFDFIKQSPRSVPIAFR